MKNKNTNCLLMIILVMSALRYTAQQNNLFNTYVYDPFQLNIAYAGHACTEANVHYRTQWIGMKDAPTFIQVNAHTAIGKSNGMGLRVISQQMGLLNNTQATLGYAYRFKVSSTANVHLGLGIGWTQSVFNAQKATVIDANDATLGNGKQKANGFDSEFGAMYLGQKFKAGISVLHLYNSNPSFAASNYKLLPQSNINVSYIFNKNKKVEIEPWLVDRYTINGTHIIEGILNMHIAKVLTVGAGYRSNYGVLGFVGIKTGNIKVAYSFDYGTSKNATVTGSSHQILLGFSICKTSKTLPPKEEEPVAVITPTIAPEPLKEEAKQVIEEKKETVAVKETPKEEMKIGKPAAEEIIKTINLKAEEILFELGKSNLDEATLARLDDIAKILKENPDVKINIIGHTCNKGGAESNKALSAQRAAYVKNQLQKRGVPENRIKKLTGVGSEKELYSNDEVTQSKNRTVRFELTK